MKKVIPGTFLDAAFLDIPDTGSFHHREGRQARGNRRPSLTVILRSERRKICFAIKQDSSLTLRMPKRSIRKDDPTNVMPSERK